jgi:fructan beta-fructosidase
MAIKRQFLKQPKRHFDFKICNSYFIMKKKISLLFFLSCLFADVMAQPSVQPTPQWRPLYHFTPLKNWTNDPNGLIYINGVYHLYNQQNPFENKWGHMSWGHAATTDLIHWKHLPVAIPETIDKDTTWIFSGSAVSDKNNTSGFCKTKNCIVAIYTAHQPNLKKESQYIAYSNDGGITFTNYKNNPVIDLQMKDFRDPNVFWFEKTKQWVMVVSLPTEHKVRIYGSPDLKNWNLLSEFGPQGYSKANWECPFLVQLPVDDNINKQKWVLVTSAAGRERGIYEQYFTGDFDGKTFINDNAADDILTLDYGDCFYAAIPWNNLPAGKKIFIGWMVPQAQETYPWRGQMSIPRDMSLRTTKDGIRLYQQPASVIKNQLAALSGNDAIELKNIRVNGAENSIFKGEKINGNSYWLEAKLEVRPGVSAGFNIAEKKDKNNKVINATVIGYDASKRQVYIDRSNSGNEKLNDKNERLTADIDETNGEINLEILLDKSSLEVFVNNGEKVLTTYIFPLADADGLSAFSDGGNTLIKSIKIWNLSKVKQ